MRLRDVMLNVSISFMCFLVGLWINKKIELEFILLFGMSLYASAIGAYALTNNGFKMIPKSKLKRKFMPIFIVLFIVCCLISYGISKLL